MDLNHFKTKLEEEKRKLESQLGGIAVRDPDVPGDWDAMEPQTDGVNTGDETADRLEDMYERKAEEKTLETQLQKVNEALERIASGSYGKCEVGGEEIEEDRLLANPSARTCKAHLNEE
ncbi:MAG: TraR/DksA C4-type zinc finger protein [Patescibacteria group bacterium]